MHNIEIKARYLDLKKAKAIALKMGAGFAGIDLQIDTYFKTPQGRLKLRESSLKKAAELIPYVRPNQDGPKKSEYLLLPVSQPEELKNLLTNILGLEVVVEKKREIFLLDNVRIHLDEVKGLGNFFEFEAVYNDLGQEASESGKVTALIESFEIPKGDLISGSYRELCLKL